MESQLSSLENIVKLQRVRMKEAFTAITEVQGQVQNLMENHYITLDEFKEFSNAIAGALEAMKTIPTGHANAADGTNDFVTVDEFCQVCNGITSKVKEHANVIASFQQSITNGGTGKGDASDVNNSPGDPLTSQDISNTAESGSSKSKAIQVRLATIENKMTEKLNMVEFKECFNAIEDSVKEL